MTEAEAARATPRVLVVVVTYKSDDLVTAIGQTLATFLNESGSHFCATVENSGSDRTSAALGEALQAHADRHLHLQPAENRGFSPAVNDAYQAAVARWGDLDVVILLNPDVMAAERVLGPLVEALISDSGVAIAAPVLVDEQGHVDRGTARRRWTPLNLLAETAGVGEQFAKGTRYSRYIEFDQAPVDVDITSGALMAIRTSALGDGLDTRLPLYLEDQEICHRAHAMGFRVTVYPHLTAVHTGGASRVQNTESQRNLRCMELANSPAMSMQDWSGVPISVSRLTIALGASTRIVVACAALVVPRRREWAKRQIQLGRWLLGWAVHPDRWGQRL